MRNSPDRSARRVRGRRGKISVFRLCVPAALAFFLVGAGIPAVARLAVAEEVSPDDVRVEVFLAKNHTKESEAIEKGFGEASVRNVRFQYFRAGRPPANIAIGGTVPAPIARLAIRLAGEYAEGIQFIVPQPLLPTTWIGIGTSAFDEKNLIPISPENLKRLSDPSLSSKEFHALYDEFAELPKIY